MLTRSPALLVPLAVIASLLLAACGSNSYDAGTIEKYLVQSQQGKVRGLAIGDASCPKDVTLKEGVTFTCTLQIAGEPAPYTVTLTNVDADKVHISLEPAKALIATAAVADLVRNGLKPAYRDAAKINCGDKELIVTDPGTKIGCIVKIGNDQVQAVARVENKDGKVVLVKN